MLIDKLLGSSGKIGLEVEPEDLAGQLVGVLQQGTELTDQLFVGPIILVTEKVRQQADGFDLTFHFPCFWARHSQSKARKKGYSLNLWEYPLKLNYYTVVMIISWCKNI